MAKKKSDSAKKQKIKLLVLIAILVGTIFLFVFVTLPSMGINIFGGSAPSASNSKPSTTDINNSKPLSGTLVSSANISQVDKNLLSTVLDEIKKDREQKSYDDEVFSPYYLKIEDSEEVGKLLTSDREGITDFEAADFVSYFKDYSGEKKAWIRMRDIGDKIFELKVNSFLPDYSDMQVLDINSIGILIYKYPKLSSGTEKGIGPKLYRIVAQPYKETKFSL